MPKLRRFFGLLRNTFDLLLDSLRLIGASLQPQCRLAAESLFLRKQLALYLERQVKPRRAKAATRLTLVLLSRLFVWREVLTVVKPETLIRWHRQGVRMFWRWKSKPRGRPRVPSELQKLIAEMADDNPTWGEECIAAELLLKLGDPDLTADGPPLCATRSGTSARRLLSALDDVCPQPCPRDSSLRFFRHRNGPLSGAVRLRGHGSGITPNRSFQRHRSSLGGMDAALASGGGHGRGSVPIPHPRPRQHLLPRVRLNVKGDGSKHLENALPSTASERLVGTIRRECLDFLIPLTERHLRGILKEWVAHYNQSRPHSSLGPGIPEPSGGIPAPYVSGYGIPCGHRVVGIPILGGLHHDYRLEKVAA